MFKRTLIIGDVHGCLDELVSLIDLFDYRRAHDRLIFVGDLINRGPDPMGVLELVAKLNADCVLGNHELGFLKFLDTGVMARSSFATLKKAMGDRVHYWKTWLGNRPLFIKNEGVNPEDSFLVVHAGLVPGIEPEDTPPDILACVRNWDIEKGEPGGERHPPWFEFYHGTRTVLFGHWAAGNVVMRSNVIGLDSGCVYGGFLSGLSWPDRVLYQIPSKCVYHSSD